VVVQHALLPSDRVATLHAGESIKVYKNVPIAQGSLDKGTVFRYIMQAFRDAALTLATHNYKIPIGPGAGAPGDSGKPQAPPLPPSNPPPSPPTH
jgi:hypothetical protein